MNLGLRQGAVCAVLLLAGCPPPEHEGDSIGTTSLLGDGSCLAVGSAR